MGIKNRITLFVEDDVFGFQVPVQNPVGMYLFECLQYAGDKKLGFSFAK